MVKHLPLPWPKPVKERGLQKLSLAVAIAAVLAVFTIAWWSWPRLSAPPAPAHSEPSWVAQIHEKRDRIRALIEPRERVEQLTVLAAELRGQAESLTYDGDAQGLASLANAYKELLGDDLLGPARPAGRAARGRVRRHPRRIDPGGQHVRRVGRGQVGRLHRGPVAGDGEGRAGR